MSGTSLDGIDVALVGFRAVQPVLIDASFVPYDAELRSQLLALHEAGHDELNRAAIVSNQLSQSYAQAAQRLLERAGFTHRPIAAIGCHGQTVRHCPENGKRYTIQLVNAAMLAELTKITVVADFRNRDLAAGGQGAPLVPAFHRAIFHHPMRHRVIVNIGGIANITRLHPNETVIGFDCGPGNLLLDAWCLRHQGESYDAHGRWAESGQVIPGLLAAFLADPFFAQTPPKSTGRDRFNLQWLEAKLRGDELPRDVQATLLQLTAQSIADAIAAYCPGSDEIYVCGGGVHNGALLQGLREVCGGIPVAATDQLGVSADWVEAYAFAWLARQTLLRQPGNLPAVTGARGERILGAIYPA